jgi:TorA maturation chaperone TorD
MTPLPYNTPFLKSTPDNVTFLAQADLVVLLMQMMMPPSVHVKGMFDDVTDIDEMLEYSNLPNPHQLAELFQQIRIHGQATQLDIWEQEYNRLFEGNVLCPINETGFVRRERGAILADIAGFYQAFGFQLSDTAKDKVDHLRCELEFVALLLIMLAKAQEEALTEGFTVTQEALAAFTFDHLGEWLDAFCERLQELTVLPYYQQVAQFLTQSWAGLVSLHQLPMPTGVGVEKTLADREETPYECGMVEETVEKI